MNGRSTEAQKRIITPTQREDHCFPYPNSETSLDVLHFHPFSISSKPQNRRLFAAASACYLIREIYFPGAFPTQGCPSLAALRTQAATQSLVDFSYPQQRKLHFSFSFCTNCLWGWKSRVSTHPPTWSLLHWSKAAVTKLSVVKITQGGKTSY